ncbi:MAG TPA: CDP-glycerol glycerophosphotransferase family protein [Nocardioides sp.]|uniref:CDP-glycerol glycerophosphotransferase family protein n=1 Tax=Nocardioides sp. TaxID=35761 RepID=UPI002ED8DECE
MSYDAFLADWRAFVAAWDRARSDSPEAAERLVRDALRSGLPHAQAAGATVTADRPSRAAERACAIALIAASGEFDEDGYVRHNAELIGPDEAPLANYVRDGWQHLRYPNARFDGWWYWNEYLDPTREEVDPFLHYLLAGRAAGHRPRPERRAPLPDPPRPAASGPPRRICLFAAYDVDGIVDDYVVHYLRDLSRFADVYYLADGRLSDAELAKLGDVTAAAWAVPHGRYDFGSYSMLATDLVGWDVIETYDELILANDSSYLVRPLDEVFSRMDAVACDWWGLQASQRAFDRDWGHTESIDLAAAKHLPRDYEDWNVKFQLHVSSYFVAFRRRVVQDPGFRRRFETVVAQDDKLKIICKYEIGLSDYLIGAGFDFTTFTGRLHPFHPLYTAEYFELLRDGFPLLKRNLLSENVKRVPDLVHWKERVRAVVPDAPVEMFERNLLRVVADDHLRRSFAIRTRPDGSVYLARTLQRAEFREEDRWAPKFDHWWAFPVCAYDHSFAGNERAVFEAVREDPSIKKIVLTRSRRVDVDGENVVVVPLTSREGQHYLLRAKQIFVKHGPRINVPWPVSSVTHNFINLWHGIPLKRFLHAAAVPSADDRRISNRVSAGSRAVIVSSDMDRLAMSAAFGFVPYADLWPTGLPRNDFLMRPFEQLPEDLRAAEQRLREELGGRRLVLFLPTFKDGQADSYYRFAPAEVDRLRAWAAEHDAVLGVREHMADRARTYSSMLAGLAPLDLSSRRYPDVEVLYRVASGLVTDYSSGLVDFSMTGRPVISFAYDLDRYATEERGLFYDLEKVVPGPVCRTFDELAVALDGVFAERTAEQLEDYEWKRRIFFDHVDDGASARVVQRVKALYER